MTNPGKDVPLSQLDSLSNPAGSAYGWNGTEWVPEKLEIIE